MFILSAELCILVSIGESHEQGHLMHFNICLMYERFCLQFCDVDPVSNELQQSVSECCTFWKFGTVRAHGHCRNHSSESPKRPAVDGSMLSRRCGDGPRH